MRRPGVIATVLALVVAVSLFGVSDVRGGGGALVLAGKTTGPGLIATIETDVTNGDCTVFQIGTDPPVFTSMCKGLTTIRVQRASVSAAVVFISSYVHSFVNECTAAPFDVVGTTNNRFTGFLMDGWIDTPTVLTSLLLKFGNPSKAAITSVDYVTCASVTYGKDAAGNDIKRQILSFTAVIQFQP